MAGGSFKVWGKDYNLPTDLTMGEMCDAEREFGVEFSNVERSGVRMAAAMMWIAIRRVDPKVDVEDIRLLPIDVFEGFIEEDDALPPVNGSTLESSGSSGETSSENGGNQDSFLEPTGVPG